MAHLALTEATGNAMVHTSLDNTTPVVQVDIGSILDQARLSSASIIQIVEHYTQLMSRIADAESLNFLNSMAASALYSHQTNLQSLQQQMATYAGAMNGNSQFHQIQANAAEAVMIAELYRSQVNVLHATIVHPATTISHNNEAQQDQSEINTMDAPTRPTTPVQVNVDVVTPPAIPSVGETADDTIKMQVDDETFLQNGLHPDELEQFNRLLEEPLEDPMIHLRQNTAPGMSCICRRPNRSLCRSELVISR